MSKREDCGCTQLLEAEPADIGPRETAVRLTEIALEREARYADVLVGYQMFHAALTPSAYPPNETPDETDPATELPHGQMLRVADLAKQTEFSVTLPDAYRITWNHDTPKPDPTDSPIFLTLLDVHTGDEWIGRKRLAVTAKRRARGSKWTLLAGIGEGKAGGGTTWSAECNASGLSFGDITSGSVEIKGGKLSLRVSAYPDFYKGVDAPWTLSGDLTLQVGHEDGRRGEPHKGDEPFEGGTGTVEIVDLTTARSTMDETAARGSAEALEEVLSVIEAQAVDPARTMRPKRSGGPSGEPSVMDCRPQTRAALAMLDPRTPMPWTPTVRQDSSRRWWATAKANRIRCGVAVHATWDADVEALVGGVDLDPPGFFEAYTPTDRQASKVATHWDKMPGRVRDPYLVQALLWAHREVPAASPSDIMDAALYRAVYELDQLLVDRQEDRSPVWRWLKRQGHVK